jgi:O-antigen/teichoic acid export membrane protein
MPTNNVQIKQNSVKTNFVFSALIKLLTYLLPLITTPYLSRILGPTGIGDYSYANSICSYFCLLVNFGFIGFGTIEISKERDNIESYSGTFWSIFFLRAIFFAIATISYSILLIVMSKEEGFQLSLYLALSLTIFANFFDITYLFQGLENFKTISLINCAVRIASTVLIFVLIKTSDDLLIYTIIQSVQLLFIAVLPWLFIHGNISKPKKETIKIKETFCSALIYFLPTLAVTLSSLIDKTMIGKICSTTEVGYYEQAYKIVLMIIALLHSLAPVMLTRITYLIKKGQEDEVNNKIRQMFEVYFLIGFPCIFGLYAIVYSFVPAFFGDDFIPSITIMCFLLPLILISTISNALGNVFYGPRGKEWMTSIFYGIGTIVNIISNALIIPKLGAEGAAITSLCSETLITSLFIVFSKKSIKFKQIALVSIKPLVASIIMFFVVFSLDRFCFSSLFSNKVIISIIDVAIGIVVYSVLILIFKDQLIDSELRRISQKIKSHSSSHK